MNNKCIIVNVNTFIMIFMRVNRRIDTVLTTRK